MSDQEMNDIEVPKWDPALESLIRDEFRNKSRGLVLQDFLDLAQQHSIRFDDIMVTVFELCIHELWSYRTQGGDELPITRDMIDKLYVNGRLQEKDLREFTGSWSLRQ